MRLSQEVLAELVLMEFEGVHARLVRPLDRALYVTVDKALQALGGKWDRKSKTHLFPTDAQTLVEAAVLAGEVTTASDLGFFPTPDGVARDLVRWVLNGPLRYDGMLLEPSVGTGSLARYMVAFAKVRSYDVVWRPELAGLLGQGLSFMQQDFMTTNNASDPFAGAVFNPPFAKTLGHDALDHVLHVLRQLSPFAPFGGILPASVKWRGDKRFVAFREEMAKHGVEYEDLPEGTFKASGTMVRTVRIRGRKRV